MHKRIERDRHKRIERDRRCCFQALSYPKLLYNAKVKSPHSFPLVAQTSVLLYNAKFSFPLVAQQPLQLSVWFLRL